VDCGSHGRRTGGEAVNPVLHFSSATFPCAAQAGVSSKCEPKPKPKRQEKRTYQGHLVVLYRGEYIVSRDGKRCFTASSLEEAKAAIRRIGGLS
jgi:hypothetical protein